ncbi:MAG: NADH-quinone oxidoreductase subunit N [Acidimicrobiaceae bacterium]|nr:NADH-quinone oxidoreductase subunit N [Acidimicrobiaceae bacterium]
MGTVLAQLPVRTPAVDWTGLLPVLLPGAGALVLLMVRSLVPSRVMPAVLDAVWTFAVAGAGLVSVAVLWQRDTDVEAFGGQLVMDGIALFVAAVVLGSVALAAPTLPGYCRRVGVASAELCVLIMLAASGAVVMAGAVDLLVLFLGLETMSIAAYVMAALNLRRLESLEAGLKYFVLGAFSTAFLLFGIALVYGATGTTNLDEIGRYLKAFIVLRDGMLLAGLAMLLVGLGFKVAAAPFHAWAPDTYVGAPTPVTAFMASAVKAAGFAALIRVFVEALGMRADDWRPAVFALACATLAIGSVLAAVQTDAKRILAYSSISHAGFILVGVQAASDEGVAAVLFYLAAYAVIAVGSFTVVGVLSGHRDDRTGLDTLAGLGTRKPALALGLTVLLLAQAGVPFTSGFVAKFSVIAAAVEARSYWLAVVAMVSAVVAAFAYLRVVVAMYFRDTGDEAETATEASKPAIGLGAGAVIVIAVLFTVAAGIAPGVLESLSSTAAGL